jgi:membrane protein implicated in regulation of membrane protease activity
MVELFTAFLAYLAVFTLGVAFLGLSVVLGWGHDLLHHDFSFGSDLGDGGGVGHGDVQDTAGPGLLSPMMLAVFFTFFGATGMLLTYFTDVSTLPVLLVSLVVSVPLYLGLYRGLVKFYSSHEKSSMGSERDAIGTVATVTVPIQPGTVGAITYVAGDRYATASARSDVPIAAGEQVVIEDMHANIARVSKKS